MAIYFDPFVANNFDPGARRCTSGEATRSLCGDACADDAYLGGERTGGTAGRGSENKVAFVAAVEMHDDRPHYVRFDPVASVSFKASTCSG